MTIDDGTAGPDSNHIKAWQRRDKDRDAYNAKARERRLMKKRANAAQ